MCILYGIAMLHYGDGFWGRHYGAGITGRHHGPHKAGRSLEFFISPAYDMMESIAELSIERSERIFHEY